MDENVVFNPQAQNTQENPPAPEAPAAQPPADAAVGVTDQATPDDQAAATDGSIEEEGSPGFLGGFLGGGLLKKLLIGIGSIILVTVIIILLIPKGQPDKAVSLQWWGLWEDTSTMQSLILD